MKYIIIIFLLFTIGCKTGLINPELTVLKANQDVNAIKGVADEISAVKGDVAGIKGDIKVLADYQAQASLGFNNKMEEIKAGRDVTTTNDTVLMSLVVKGLVGLCVTLLSILGFVVRTLLKTQTEKKFYREQTLLNVQSEGELIHLRQMQEKFKKTGGKSYG